MQYYFHKLLIFNSPSTMSTNQSTFLVSTKTDTTVWQMENQPQDPKALRKPMQNL